MRSAATPSWSRTTWPISAIFRGCPSKIGWPRFCQADPEGSRMADTETFVFRASLRPKIYRAFEISAASSLYTLAQAIVRFFDFDFDHAFGFYSGLKGSIYQSPVRYELFVDRGEGEGGARSVKRTRVVEDLSVRWGQDAFSFRLWRRVGVFGQVRRPET